MFQVVQIRYRISYPSQKRSLFIRLPTCCMFWWYKRMKSTNLNLGALWTTRHNNSADCLHVCNIHLQYKPCDPGIWRICHRSACALWRPEQGLLGGVLHASEQDLYTEVWATMHCDLSETLLGGKQWFFGAVMSRTHMKMSGTCLSWTVG